MKIFKTLYGIQYLPTTEQILAEWNDIRRPMLENIDTHKKSNNKDLLMGHVAVFALLADDKGGQSIFMDWDKTNSKSSKYMLDLINSLSGDNLQLNILHVLQNATQSTQVKFLRKALEKRMTSEEQQPAVDPEDII